MSIRTFKSFDEEAGVNVPDSDTLVKRASGDILCVGGDGDGRDTVFNGQGQCICPLFDVPKSNRSVAAAGGDRSAIPSKVEGVNVLLVAREMIANRSLCNIPNL